MPRGDRTGPWGTGAMTGRRAGFCAGSGAPGYVNAGLGWGAGTGRGRGAAFGGRGFRAGGGRGWRNRFSAAGYAGWDQPGAPAPAFRLPETDSERQALQIQAEHLESALNNIRKRLDELDAPAAEG